MKDYLILLDIINDPSVSNKLVGEAVYKLRKDMNVSREELSKLTDMRTSIISNLEGGYFEVTPHIRLTLIEAFKGIYEGK